MLLLKKTKQKDDDDGAESPLTKHSKYFTQNTKGRCEKKKKKKKKNTMRQLSAVATDVREEHDTTRSCCTEARLNSTRRERQTRTDYIAGVSGSGGAAPGLVLVSSCVRVSGTAPAGIKASRPFRALIYYYYYY